MQGPLPLLRHSKRAGVPEEDPGLPNKRESYLPIVCSIVPNLVGEVAAEEALYLLGPRVSTVEEPTRSKVVEPAVHRELQVGRDRLLATACLHSQPEKKRRKARHE